MRKSVCLLALMFATLVLVGTTPASAACCVEDGSCQDQWTMEQCLGFGGEWHEGACTANTCEQPTTGACCLEDGSCQELSAEECGAIGGSFFEGDCSTATCEQPPVEGCSPGFWKNHQELWLPDLCGDPYNDCAYLLGELDAKGPANGERKNAAADIIDGRWLATYGEPLPCDEAGSL